MAYTYASSSAAVATVTPAGVVTAVAPGVATITVSAAGTGTGFSASTLTSAVTITVSDRAAGLTSLQVSPATATLSIGATQSVTASVQGPRASAASMSYGTSAPSVATVSSTGVITAVAAGTATITVTAQSTQDGAFAASSLTGLVTVTVSPAAQVLINSLTQNGSTIDIANVSGQFEVNLALQPNGQKVQSVQAWVCEAGETVEQCASRSGSPAAEQTFGAQGGQAGTVQLYINSAEFATPDFTTGADASTLYKNGLKTIVATLTTAGTPTASNNLSSVNFNNKDGFTISWTLPTNKANDAAGNTWYGGPNGAGTGSFTVVPVLYTPNRTITQVTLAPAAAAACGANIVDNARPFRATYGAQARDTVAVAFDCTGVATDLIGHAPLVTASLDNANAAGPSVDLGTPTVARASIFNAITATSVTATKYYQSLAYRSNATFVPADYEAPVIDAAKLDVRGGGVTAADSGWVNASYAFGDTARYLASDAAVGLFPTAQRTTRFDICEVPAVTTALTAPVTCASPVATGGLTATVASINLGESSNLTNQAYYLVASESDRLGNRASTIPFGYTRTNADGSTTSITATSSKVTFGVDRTAPSLVAIPNSGTGAIATFPRTDRDSIFSTTTGEFAVRFSDTRSGFATCVQGTNAVACNVNDVLGGSFQIVRRVPTTNVPAIYTSDAFVDNLNNGPTAAARALNSAINAGTYSVDAAVREFKVSVLGAAARNTLTTGAPVPAAGTATAGYYTFSGTIVDRAGNSVTIPTRSIAIDQSRPQATGITQPLQYTGGSAVSFGVAGSDDLEVIAGDLALTYGIGTVRFHRVPTATATAALGLWHNPFAAVSDNKLTAQVGPNFALGSAQISTPVPFIAHIASTSAGVVPTATAYAAGTKPTAVLARLFDIRSTSSRDFTADSGMSTAATATINGNLIAATTKDWQALLGSGATWQLFTSTASAAEFRVTTNSSVTNPPFTRVHIVRQNAVSGELDYLGDAVFAGTLDQGAFRYFRYTFAFAGASQGQYNLAALADNNSLVAIGVDANGVGLATQAANIGLPPALPAAVTVSYSAFTTTTIGNATAAQPINFSVSTNPNSANLVYSCSSDSQFVTATMTGSGTCTVSPNGSVSTPLTVKVTFTATASRTGYTTTTISASQTVTRN